MLEPFHEPYHHVCQSFLHKIVQRQLGTVNPYLGYIILLEDSVIESQNLFTLKPIILTAGIHNNFGAMPNNALSNVKRLFGRYLSFSFLVENKCVPANFYYS